MSQTFGLLTCKLSGFALKLWYAKLSLRTLCTGATNELEIRPYANNTAARYEVLVQNKKKRVDSRCSLWPSVVYMA